MSLNRATLFSIIGISYIFVIRTIGTLFPSIFRNLTITIINTFLSFTASVVVVIFFIYFYKEYVKDKQSSIKNASLLAGIGSFIGTLLFLEGILVVVFNFYVFQSHAFDISVPWISAVFYLYFYIIYYQELLSASNTHLKNAVFLAIIGASISVLIRTILLFNYWYSGTFNWVFYYFNEFPFIYTILHTFLFFTSFYFYYSFYKYNEFSVSKSV